MRIPAKYRNRALITLVSAHFAVLPMAWAGPYSAALDDPSKPDAPVPGFIGPEGIGKARLVSYDPFTGGEVIENPLNYVNPIFFGWAASVAEDGYAPAPGVSSDWKKSGYALGPVTGDNFDVVSLGDLNATQLASNTDPGAITVEMDNPLADLPGADFVVFENTLISGGLSGVAGQVAADLGYVEVSSNGADFARFPSRSLTPAAVSTWWTIDATNVFNLAGKHANGYGDSWGTPFDLSQLAGEPLVIGGTVNLNNITYVRVVDIPGNGKYLDSHSPPSPIYDPWLTSGSGGLDLEAVGGISVPVDFANWLAMKEISSGSTVWLDDTDGDGISNALEFALGREPNRRENEAPVSIRVDADSVALEFTRDTRPRGVVFELQRSLDLKEWETVARSTDGGLFAAVAPFSPVLSDVSASPIASIGVIRRQTVRLPLSSVPNAHFRLAVRPITP